MAATKPVRTNAQLKAAVAAALAWLKKNSVPWRDEADDARFLRGLSLIEQGATDGRNFVKKGVNWALRSIGRRSRKLHAAAVLLATRLAESDDATARWVGKDAHKQLIGPAMIKRISRL